MSAATAGPASTPDAGAYAWDEFALDLVALLDQLGIERAVLGGASLGSAVSLHAAVLAPDRVGGLVLAIAPTARTTRPEQAHRYLAAARLIEQGGSGRTSPPAVFSPSRRCSPAG